MAGRGRGARSGRGWDAAPPRPTTGGRRTDRSQPAGRQRRDGRLPGDQPAAEASDDQATDGPGSAGGLPTDRHATGQPPRDEAELAREICLRQLAVRPRTRAELAKALSRRGISAEVADEILDRYDDVGLVDDAAFARAWVSSRHHGRGLARRALANELRQRGVDADTVGEALEDLDPDTEAETARVLVQRKLRSASGPPDAVFRRLVSMLARKGYPPGVAIRAVKDGLAAQSAEAAEFAEQVDTDALAEAVGGPDSAGQPPDAY